MDIETVLETCLIEFQPIRGPDLQRKIGERGVKLSRSQFMRYAKKAEKAGWLERHDGIYTHRKKSPEGQAQASAQDPLEKEKAINILQSCINLGIPVSADDWNYVLQADGKSMVEKAYAVMQVRGQQVLLGKMR